MQEVNRDMQPEMGCEATTAAEISAAELETAMTEDAQQTLEAQDAQEREALQNRVREGIGELFEDGWTVEELQAFSTDEGARKAIAEGKSVARAAAAYLRETHADHRRHGVPTARVHATSGYEQVGAIERMSDAEFDAFSRRVQAAAMEGRRVRI